MAHQRRPSKQGTADGATSPSANSSVRFAICVATLLFLATEGTSLFVLVRGHRPSVAYALLLYLLPLFTAIPWLVGLLTYLRMKKLFTRFSTTDDLESVVLYLTANGVAASYFALLPCALLLADLVTH
jgi:hypothetical protein